MKSTEENALMTKTEENYELAQSNITAEAVAEVQASIIIAKKFPRNEDQAFQKLMRACNRTSFAEDAAYSFKRGKATIKGPSINLAREGARIWGNIEYGVIVTYDDENMRKIRAFAWDKESNGKSFAEDSFKKLIYRKEGGWIKPDERDLRELTNRRGAILKRNCILELLPKDLIEDALAICNNTLKKNVAQDPDAAKKKIILAFSELSITPEMLEKKLGHPMSQSSPDEIAELRQIYKSIKDGNSKWSEYIEDESNNGKDKGNGHKGTEKGSLNMADLKPKDEKKGPTKAKPQDSPSPREQLKIALNEHFEGDIDERDKFLEKAVGKKILHTLGDDEVLKAMAKLKEKQIEQERKNHE